MLIHAPFQLFDRLRGQPVGPEFRRDDGQIMAAIEQILLDSCQFGRKLGFPSISAWRMAELMNVFNSSTDP